MIKQTGHIKFLFAILVLLLYITSCEKEYSYEGGNIPSFPVVIVDTVTPVDTSNNVDPGELPGCNFCIDSTDIAEAEWSFKTGHALLCGKVDTAIMLSLARNTFTFFGPATCGVDTGMIFTISLGPNSLDRDRENIVATSAVFYYYHTNAPYVLVSHNDQPFSFTITSYVQATKMLTGTFNGSGFRQDGRAVNVTDGKFKCKIL
ncbi:MAG: hypothetical protein IPP72_02485 [Chitinophagaceae bacterium]|nr:hypothetical protein [Chitinophagaceae bacterium]